MIRVTRPILFQVPVSLGGPLHDPFLLLAHHKHWFDPRDPLRGPFKALGKALGLPYVDVEGFKLHPHRGFDIVTYVLDGSDGFRHRDSLGGSRVYRGGCAQWMRTGSGVLHEEFWETRNDRRTNIELFQLWVNLPARQKFDPPHIHYVGATTAHPWVEHHSIATGVVKVRDIGATLDASLPTQQQEGKAPIVNSRPPVSVLHVTMQANSQWEAPAPRGYSALLYVREGTATLPSLNKLQPEQTANALQTATFSADGDSIVVHNTQRRPLDFLLLTAAPLREPVALGGPIVMNTEEELNDAFRQLSEGTFLNRNVALRQQADTLRRTGRMV